MNSKTIPIENGYIEIIEQRDGRGAQYDVNFYVNGNLIKNIKVASSTPHMQSIEEQALQLSQGLINLNG